MATADAVTPPLPAGFVLDRRAPDEPPLPPGFVLQSNVPRGTQDTSSKAAFLESGLPPVKEPEGDFPGSEHIANLEALGTVGTGMFGQLVGPVVGAGRRLFGGTMQQAEQTAADVARGMTYEPRTPKGRSRLGTILNALEVSKLAGMGPPEQMALAGAAKPSISLPTRKSVEGEIPVPPTPQPPGAGAGRVSGELQRIRGVLGKSQLEPPPEAVLSAPEQLLSQRTEITNRLPDIFAEAKPVELKGALAAIEQAELKALSKDMIGPIKEARETIERAISKSRPAGVPERMTAAEYRQMVDGQKAATSLSLEMADEVRQSLGAIISKAHAKIEDKPLAARTTALLTNIQNALTGSARKSSSEYGKWLDEYGQLSGQLDKFKQPESVLARTTVSGEAPLSGGDAQRKLESIFTSATRDRDFKNFVDTVTHSPEQVKNLRQAIGEYVAAPNAMTEVPTSESLVGKWKAVRQSVKDSGLMTEEHYNNVDSLIEDIRRASRAGKMGRIRFTLGGFFAGFAFGHPFMGSHFAREIGQKITNSGMEKRIAELMTSGAIADADMARYLNSPVTPANIERIRVMLPTDLAAALAPTAARQDLENKRRSQAPARAGEIGPPPQ